MRYTNGRILYYYILSVTMSLSTIDRA